MGVPRFFADNLTLDTASTDGNCGYPATPLGVAIACPSIMTSTGPLLIVPEGQALTVVPGQGLLCAAIGRTAVSTATTDNEKGGGVRVQGGLIPMLAPNRLGGGGDGAQGSLGAPNPRLLTSPVIQNKIVIGSGGTYVPPEFSE